MNLFKKKQKNENFNVVAAYQQSDRKGMFCVTIKDHNGILISLLLVEAENTYQAYHTKEVRSQIKEFQKIGYKTFTTEGGQVC